MNLALAEREANPSQQIEQVTSDQLKPPNSHPGRNFGFDLARAIAIALVVVSHFAQAVEHLGFWGVELFFGLSGFLIGRILWRSYLGCASWSIRPIHNFWLRRWYRTLPNYYLFLFVAIGFSLWRSGSLPSPLAFSKYLWFGQDLLSREGSFYGISWSLCIEEWFYLSFPLVLLICDRVTGARKHLAFLMTIFTVILASVLVRNYLLGQSPGTPVRGVTLARLDSIASGVFVAFVSCTLTLSSRTRFALAFCGVVIFGYSMKLLYFSGYDYVEAKANSLLLLSAPVAFSLMLPAIGLLPKPQGAFSCFRLAVEKTSLWSYSMYLCHIPILFLVYDLMDGFRDSALLNLLSKFIGLIMTVLLSALLYRFFEVPLLRLRPAEIKGDQLRPAHAA